MKNALINGDSLNILKKFPDNSFDSMVTDPPAGIAFMGKKWDKDKGGRKLWIAWLESIMTEAFRTLKPGAHILVWAIPRTSHWTATAIENAEFEIRDVVTHIFGSGFPKSQNISKSIDKQQEVERTEVIGTRHRNVKPFDDDNGWNQNNTKGDHQYMAPASDNAKKWDGWGSALKPASEHWILARKPLSEKTIAANVLEHGTGGINIDASRIGTTTRTRSSKPSAERNGFIKGFVSGTEAKVHNKGRFPANLVLSHKPGCKQKCDDDCAIKTLDEQTGILTSGEMKGKIKGKAGKDTFGSYKGEATEQTYYADSGGPSRFFYCAKASKKEKTLNKTIENKHPTVKPLKLMKYLIKMITPPGGTVLDPFMGSGTTGQAAIEEDFGFVGVELEINSYDIAKERIPSINNLICSENA